MHAPLRRPLLLILVLVAATLALAGCGSDESTDSKARDSKTTSTAEGGGDGAAGEVDAELKIRLERVGDTKAGAGLPVPTGIACTKSIPATCSGEVVCPAPTPDGIAVCEWLAGPGRAALAAVGAEDEACTMIYGGPETATITGTLDGEKIDASFSREHGCAIARFDAVAPLWTGEVMTPAPPTTAPPSTDVPPDPDTAVSSPPEPEEISDPPAAFEN